MQHKNDGTKVLLTGGSGLVGNAIARELMARAVPLVQAVRGTSAPGRQPDGREMISWDPEAKIPFARAESLDGVEVAIHLSGESLMKQRWTPEFKRRVGESRVQSTRRLARVLASMPAPPKVLIAASAIGIYGERGDEVLTENSPAGEGFLAELCRAWEAASDPAREAGIRVVNLRIGVVLAPQDGALRVALPLFRMGLGGRIASGRQWLSWIGLDDLVGAVMHVAGYGREGNGAAIVGPINCTAPNPVRNEDYTRELAGVLHRPAILPVPAFALRIAMGEIADAALMVSCRALPDRLLESGFRFQTPQLGPALRKMLSEKA